MRSVLYILFAAVLAVPILWAGEPRKPRERTNEDRLESIEKEVKAIRAQLKRLMPEDDEELFERLEKLDRKTKESPREWPERPWLPIEDKPSRRSRW